MTLCNFGWARWSPEVVWTSKNKRGPVRTCHSGSHYLTPCSRHFDLTALLFWRGCEHLRHRVWCCEIGVKIWDFNLKSFPCESAPLSPEVLLCWVTSSGSTVRSYLPSAPMRYSLLVPLSHWTAHHLSWVLDGPLTVPLPGLEPSWSFHFQSGPRSTREPTLIRAAAAIPAYCSVFASRTDENI